MKAKLVTFIVASAICASLHGQIKNIVISLDGTGKTINPDMYGIFFEDINFGADGGLYAELVKNRSFEFPQPFMGWSTFGKVRILDSDPCFDRNPHYANLTNDGSTLITGLQNEGFKGIGVEDGKYYNFSAYVRTRDTEKTEIAVYLVDSYGHNHADRNIISIEGDKWHKVELPIKADFTDSHASFRVVLRKKGSVDLDHISLFPADTWKNWKNGLRKDLVQALYDLHPGVFRFPGGCIIEGTTLENRYQWKNSIGPVENRPLNINRWNYTFEQRAFPDYYQSLGLGFYEYFLLAEDIGAEPLPVISCGIACQYQSGETVPLDKLDPYIQDALDLIEFANGPVSSNWGSKRAEMGHPQPFNLKYLAVGNEQWGHEYVERAELFMKVLKKEHPEIIIVGTAGPSESGEKFDYLWPEMKRLKADLVDEHYYMSPEWFLGNAGRYDSYDREGPKVFAGEYASHDGKHASANNWLAALSEAAFMTGLERNADVVRLATYAPLFAHVDAWQWCPDLIWFDNLRVMKSPSYYVQQMFSCNKGTDVLETLCDGKSLTGEDGLYASSVYDRFRSEIIVKVVNTLETSRNIEICFTGLKKKMQIRSDSCILLHNDDLTAVNNLDDETVKPEIVLSYGADKTGDNNGILVDIEPLSFKLFRFTVNQ